MDECSDTGTTISQLYTFPSATLLTGRAPDSAGWTPPFHFPKHLLFQVGQHSTLLSRTVSNPLHSGIS